ncbi:MAG: DNA mismatch repair endonuclease MutL [Acidobacteriota bacterium]
MTSVRVLPSELINQIAAGEVVERPSSVVKELVENAIDAGAQRIEIILENGGRSLIDVRDDGCGMNEGDAGLALERHATSKIAVFDDLLSVRTLGFRGEALPSIASVSRFTLLTWDGISPTGTEIECDPILGVHVRPAARDRGTSVRVAELFENVPARRKFLKSSDAEFRQIVSVVTSYSLPVPQRSFRLEHNGRVVLDLTPAADLRERALQILGAEAAPFLSELSMRIDDSEAVGLVTRGLRYGSRRHQYFFVNGRLVKDRVLAHASARASDAFDFEGHPAVFLFLEIAPSAVDVNVHPAKTEVRFRDSGKVHVVVEQAIRAALGGAEEGVGLLQPAEGELAPVSVIGEVRNGQGVSHSDQLFAPTLVETSDRGLPFENSPLFRDRPVVQPPLEAAPVDLGALKGRVIGQYRMSYLLIDSPDGLRLIDQHVAHERVLYDSFEKQIETGKTEVQRLLTPVLYEAPIPDVAVLESHLEELRGTGFEIERFSGNSFAVAAVPAPLQGANLPKFFQKLVEASVEEKTSHWSRLRHRVLASLACQAAIKVHRSLTGGEMSRLVEDLLHSSNPYACPHGRPIIVDIRHVDIEKHFHRR